MKLPCILVYTFNVKACRQAVNGTEYNFRGCFSIIAAEMEANQWVLLGLASGVLAGMLLNMASSVALCLLVQSKPNEVTFCSDFCFI